jgi:Amt family ammonium transporter
MAMIIVTILWVVIGFGLSFGPSIGGIIGNPLPFILSKCRSKYSLVFSPTIPFLLFALFQAKFAIITPALITGAFAERIAFGPICYSWFFYFTDLCPLCHMTWHPDGLFFKMGVLDFARYSST